MIQIKARIAYCHGWQVVEQCRSNCRGNGAPLSTTAGMQEVEQRMEQLSRAVTQGWVILDVPNPLIYKDRSKPALAWTALSRLAVDGYSGVWMPCHASAGFGCVSHNHPSG